MRSSGPRRARVSAAGPIIERSAQRGVETGRASEASRGRAERTEAADLRLCERAGAGAAPPTKMLTAPSGRVHSYIFCYYLHMATVTNEVSTRELRSHLSDVLGRAMYAGERIGVTRNGKLAAVVVSVADLEALEEFEMAQDVAAYREAKATDDGARVTLAELRGDLSS